MALFGKTKRRGEPVDVKPLVQQGLQHLQASRWRDAISVLESAVEATPKEPAARGYLCQAYARSGDGARAIEHFRVFQKSDPVNAARFAEQDPWLTSGREVKSVGTSQRNQYTYESYVCSDATVAKEFLKKRDVDRPNYYVDIETPDGIWGSDIDGLYQARLPQWKTDLSLAECDGAVGFAESAAVSLCVKGMSDNFIVDVRCGRCESSWVDAVRYQNTSVVRCPSCGTYNKAATDHIRLVLLKE